MKSISKLSGGLSLVLVLLLLLGNGASIAQGLPEMMKLPAGAVKLPDIMPVSWERWGVSSEQPMEPAYLVYKGKVIGLEYMLNPPMLTGMTQLPSPDGAVRYEHDKILSVNARVNFIAVAYVHPGHAGLKETHDMVHFMFRPPEEIYELAKMDTPAAISEKPDTKDTIKINGMDPIIIERHANPKNLPFGPIALKSQDKLVGWEFMFNYDKYAGGPVETPQGQLSLYWLGPIPVDADVNHFTFSYYPKGHAGWDKWHYNIQLYNISPQKRIKIVKPGLPTEETNVVRPPSGGLPSGVSSAAGPQTNISLAEPPAGISQTIVIPPDGTPATVAGTSSGGTSVGGTSTATGIPSGTTTTSGSSSTPGTSGSNSGTSSTSGSSGSSGSSSK